MKAVMGGTIFTPTKKLEKGTVIIQDGKILDLGENLTTPEEAEIIDVRGKYILPGLVDGHTHIGMVTDAIEWEASDVNDFSGPVTPQMKAIDAINLYDPGFDEALSGGVTTVYSGPGSSNVLGGIGVIVKTHGDPKEKMVVKDFGSIKMALGPKRSREEVKSKEPYPTTRMGSVALVRANLKKAYRYFKGELDPDKLEKEERLMMENLSKLFSEGVPAHIHTSNMPDELYAAINLINEFNLTASIDHGFGSELVADTLAEEKIPVIYGPVLMAKKRAGSRYISDDTPGILASKGVKTSIMTDAPLIPGKNLLLSAQIAYKNGMDPIEALKAITINPAETIGVGDRVGSLEPGKDADIIILSESPFSVRTVVETVILNGKISYQR
jgi:imidazolonepropionase-like amidohydrolase